MLFRFIILPPRHPQYDENFLNRSKMTSRKQLVACLVLIVSSYCFSTASAISDAREWNERLLRGRGGRGEFKAGATEGRGANGGGGGPVAEEETSVSGAVALNGNNAYSASPVVVAQRRLMTAITDTASLRTAVTAWCDDATAGEATYGHISTWDTS